MRQLVECACAVKHSMFIRCKDEDDFVFYERLMAAGVQRQVARAASDVMTADGCNQLHEAFVFHYRDAWDNLKYGLKSIFTIRCIACGGRHWKTKDFAPREGEVVRGQVFGACFYGYSQTLKHGWRTWWYAGLHGDD